MLKSILTTYQYFRQAFFIMELNELLDQNNEDFKTIYFKIYHEELAKDIGIRTLSVFRQPKSIVDQFYREWFSGPHRQFRQAKWRIINHKHKNFMLLKNKNPFFYDTMYTNYFDKNNYFYNGVDYFKHVRYTFFRILYTYYRLYGFYNLKMYYRFVQMRYYTGFSKRKTAIRAFSTYYFYRYYYSLPFFVLNFRRKIVYANKISNAQFKLSFRFHKIKNFFVKLFINWLSFSNIFWAIFYIIVFIPMVGIKFFWYILKLLFIKKKIKKNK